ncbi:leucyl/phenylalanyl-tRNA--protein transferase [Microlunatus sagamiharensis]|uniref:Leucyl/phenylalanyl-tRNA--protein transferase n=1 Tax=Microlunatus sagamiharensis TaxID=546874 RepID=A0A1H2NAZ6_9ACTN|nr:leucyl/phenylalanyl-tRNA--protein transferase [Microlunatus sagamiharensis]SDV02468.1 leucyl/phenylalanyl-tRNA--protein transferase [Microlunatus sagamiharensis]
MTARPRRAVGPFGAPESWPDDDLVAVSHDIDGDLTLAAYASGVFPMPLQTGLMGWWSPVARGVLPLEGLRVTRSLRKTMRRYEIRVDTAFPAVLAACADLSRPHGWIDEQIAEVYLELHDRGVVHSVESWADDELVGGLYGVSLGGLFAGESMFHHPERGRDASKAALVGLVELLRGGAEDGTAPDASPRLLDVQWRTDHLESLGVVELDRPVYLRRLAGALTLPGPDWGTAPAWTPVG